MNARAAVPRYWIVDVNDRFIVEFTEPCGARYRNERRLRPGDLIALGDPDTPLEGRTIDAGEVLG